MGKETGRGLGNWLGPPRFFAFLAALLILVPLFATRLTGIQAFLAAFDAASILFALSTIPLFRGYDAHHMRETARRNDANRVLLLIISGVLSVAVLCAIALELEATHEPQVTDKALVIGSLLIAWIFGNLIYTLHYAHVFYVEGPGGKDCGGIDFPGTEEPDYWDFLYFAFTLGMTFQTSDTNIKSRAMRRIVIFHCAAAFVFNIGILAFSINVLGN